MDNPLSTGGASHWQNYYPHPVFNVSGEEIPQHAVMLVTGASTIGDDVYYNVAKPDGSTGFYILNGPTPVAISGWGISTNRFPAQAAYTGTTPVFGAEWGPVNGSWLLQSTGTGFIIVGGSDGSYVRVRDTSTTSTQSPVLIRAQVKGNPAPEATTFTVDNVLPLAGGLDPVSGNSATEIVVFKNPRGTWHEDLYDNEEVTCAYQPGASVSPAADWILIPVERRRSIRGKAYTAYLTSATTIEIDGIHALESGLDPRTDPTDATERVEVSNTAFSQAFADNEDVYADWNCKAGVWEARKKIPGDAGASGTYVCVLSGNLAAGSIATPATGTATVYSISGPGGTTTSLGTRTVISHRDYILYASGNAYYCQLTYAAEDPADSEFTVISDHMPAWLNSQAGYSLGGVQVFTHGTDAGFDWITLACQEVVTAVACVGGEVTGTTATYYVIACTP